MWQRAVPTADRVAAVSARLGAVTVTTAGWLALARALVLTAGGAAVAVTAVLTHDAVAAGTLSGPVMALLVLLPLALTDVALPCADAGVVAARTEAAADRLAGLERTPPAVADIPGRSQPEGSDVALDGMQARWDLRAPCTSPVGLDLAPGDRVALVGASGSGKSTVAAVLLRFLDPSTGSARIGGAELADTGPDDVRRMVGLVDDQPHVFATTLLENVRLARPEASTAEVEGALRAACLGPWLDALPDGLDTWLGTGHAGVSGGERARIGVARSLLADHPVLVLDEPTAHLDHATAEQLAHEVMTGPRTRSVLWITHGTAGRGLVDRTVELTGPAGGAEGPTRPGASARVGGTAPGRRVEP